MKKINLLIAAGLLASASMQAQTTIASLGFEDGDKSYVTSTAYDPGKYGNWINQLEGDVWNEESTEDKHSGSKSFQLNNQEGVTGNTWERGFVVGNLNLKDNTSYRVSFWVKAGEATYLDGDGNERNTSLKSSLFIGHEYCDMPICAADGTQYYYNYNKGELIGGEWQRFSYVTFFLDKATLDTWSTNYTGKADRNGVVVVPQSDPFPNEYGLIINMYSPGEYFLDDIKVEEGVAFNQATFLDDCIKLDFGYETNIAELAKAHFGYVALDPSCVTVTINGTAAPVAYVEGQEDGFLYIFLNEVSAKEGDKVVVSFTPAADCPIIYTASRRPSADTETEMQVLGFKDEVAYFDMGIDALPSVWGPGVLMSSNPENESFELDATTLSPISFTFDKEMDIDNASAYFEKNGIITEIDYTAISLSDDKKTVNIAVGKLGDGEYTLVLSGMANVFGVESAGDYTLSFAVGKDKDDTKSEVIYATDFDNDQVDAVPCGWLTKSNDPADEEMIHEYGFMPDGSRYLYGWSPNNPTGKAGGSRLYGGFSGDFKTALYWCSRQTGLGYASFGELVSEYLKNDGTLDMEALAAKYLQEGYTEEELEALPKQIALKLEPRKYQISFTMAAWKGEPTFNFTLEDLKGNIYARFDGAKALPTCADNGGNRLNGGAVTGASTYKADFTVAEDGYYMLKFSNAVDAQWQEFLLANVKLITMPSKAAYYRQLLEEAVAKVAETEEQAAPSEYDGETKTAFFAALKSAREDHFTSGGQITALIEKIETLGAAMQTRITNIDDFSIALLEASAGIETLEGKYVEADIAKKAQAIVAKYENTNPSNLSDAELNKATPELKTAAAQVVNVEEYVKILTYGADQAAHTAKLLGRTDEEAAALALVTDNREVIDGVNAASTYALYQKIANGEDLSELMENVYDTQNQNPDSEEGDPGYNDEGYPLLITGIDFTGLIVNPHLYTYTTNGGAAFEENTVPGWTCNQLEYDLVNVNSAEGAHVTGKGSVHSANGDGATEAMPVADIALNSYSSGSEYEFYQVIENVPVGVYDFYFASRTGNKNYAYDEEGHVGIFNAQNEEGVWDKYIFVQVDDEEPLTSPFPGSANSWAQANVVRNITVKEGQTLKIGVREHIVSNNASGHDYDAEAGAYKPTTFWDCNTYVDDARLFFVKPLDGYDYGKGAEDALTGIDAVATAGAAKKNAAIYNLAGQRVNESYKGIVIKNGKKVLVK